MKCCIWALLSLVLMSPGLQAQSSVHLRCNAWLDFDISVTLSGTHALNSSEWAQTASRQENWQSDQEILTTDRDINAIPHGDTVYFDIGLSHGLSQVDLRLRIIGDSAGSRLAYAADGPGFSSGWLDDGNFHQHTLSIDGIDLILKYKPDNNDNNQSRDLRFVLHQPQIYSIDSTDFADPQVINVMSYNLQMLPLGVVGMPDAGTRGDLFPAHIDPHQDVVIFQEVFDPLPRMFSLEPAMAAAGFPYDSGILNDYLPFNGGVMIYSRWPIEATDELDFLLCGPNSGDCFANKGIKYARINKLGTRYHIFGTHMDAGSDAQDLVAKNLQFKEMRDFIAAQNIPANEPILYGGDFNVSPLSSSDLYPNMQDSLDPIVPKYVGYHTSTMNGDSGHVIDHVWADPRSVHPTEAEVDIMTFRSIDSDLWDLSEFSDHRTVVGRYRFPKLEVVVNDTVMCPGGDFDLSASADIPVNFHWRQDSTTIVVGAVPTVQITQVDSMDSGSYSITFAYSQAYGGGADIVNRGFYPNGAVQRDAEISQDAGNLSVDEAACPVASADFLEQEWTFFPNPVRDHFVLRALHAGGRGTWVLYDLQGNAIRDGKLSGKESRVEVEGISKGLYLLQIFFQNKSVTHRMLVH